MVVKDLLLNLITEFSSLCIESPKSEAEWLLTHVLDITKSELLINPDRILNTKELSTVNSLTDRRKSGEPIQYITGYTEFYNTRILVGPGVLIPRPETEKLVETALDHYKFRGDILDLCTGSGAIAFALAKELSPSPFNKMYWCSTIVISKKSQILPGPPQCVRR